jgi:formimidoylglutamate deiminase
MGTLENIYFFDQALVGGRMEKGVRMSVDAGGTVGAIEVGTNATGAVTLAGIAVPGLPNLHSHAFQRAMAGLAESKTGGKDDFWSWRQVMYGFLAKLGPDDVRVIASQLYVEMLKAGYTSVAEFHYLHHAIDGAPYNNRAEISLAIIDAARQSGIGLSLLPVLYMTAGFSGGDLSGPQIRFFNEPEGLLQILDAANTAVADEANMNAGVAFHSLRAVPADVLKDVLASIAPEASVHIHIAEQQKEVEECLETHGKRPLEWLFDLAQVDRRWCLIHATHLNDDEIGMLANSGAVAGLCPTTEANLGDGFFKLSEFLKAGGIIGVGSDSHISIDACEELRLLEYGARLRAQRRIVAVDADNSHAGANLWRRCVAGGAQAMGRAVSGLATGQRADFLMLDQDHPGLLGKSGDEIMDALVFSNHGNPVRDVYVGGRCIIHNRYHKNQQQILSDYAKTLAKLKEA